VSVHGAAFQASTMMNAVQRHHMQFIHYCIVRLVLMQPSVFSHLLPRLHALKWLPIVSCHPSGTSCIGRVWVMSASAVPSFLQCLLVNQRIVSTSFSLAPGRVHLSRAAENCPFDSFMFISYVRFCLLSHPCYLLDYVLLVV
jgi:hypothetical protein